MKPSMKKALSLLLILVLLTLQPVQSAAQGVGEAPAKEEVVYVKLSPDGAYNQAYVINSFLVTEPGEFKDFGNYDKVFNLTSTDKLTMEDSQVNIPSSSGKFYYQGNLKAAKLPWTIKILYFLNGNPLTAKDAAGTTGRLEIQLHIQDNPDAERGFSENYSLQTVIALDGERCSIVEAPGATIATAGRNKVLNFIKLPGNEARYSVVADVRDFEMGGIQISGIPFSMSFDFPDKTSFKDDLSLLQKAIKELDNGTQELCGGSESLTNGVVKLHKGLEDIQSGMDQLKRGLGQLTKSNQSLKSASQQILDGLTVMQSSLDTFRASAPNLSQLTEGSSSINHGINQLSKGLNSLQDGLFQADEGIRTQSDGAYNGLSQANEATIASLHQQIAVLQLNPEVNAAQIQQLKQIAGLLSANNELLTGVKAGINGFAGTTGLAAGASTLAAQYAQFDASIQQMPSLINEMMAGIQALKEGIDQLTTSYGRFHVGVSDYLSAAEGIYKGFSQLCNGVGSIVGGGSELKNGMQSLHGGIIQLADGTGKMRNETENMDARIESKIDEMLSAYLPEDFKVVSFTSPKNTRITSVQFIMMTEGIRQEKREDAQKPTPPKASFWQKLMALFGLVKVNVY